MTGHPVQATAPIYQTKLHSGSMFRAAESNSFALERSGNCGCATLDDPPMFAFDAHGCDQCHEWSWHCRHCLWHMHGAGSARGFAAA